LAIEGSSCYSSTAKSDNIGVHNLDGRLDGVCASQISKAESAIEMHNFIRQAARQVVQLLLRCSTAVSWLDGRQINLVA
jgi:hypothetical protein